MKCRQVLSVCMHSNRCPWNDAEEEWWGRRYLAEFEHTLSEAQVVEDVNAAMAAHGTVKLLYDSQEHYETLTQALSMLREWKDGVPRGGYRGVVTIHSNVSIPGYTFQPIRKLPRVISSGVHPCCLDW